MPPKKSPSKKTNKQSSKDEDKASIVSKTSTERPSRSEKKSSIVSNAHTKRATLDSRKSTRSIGSLKMEDKEGSLKKVEKAHEKRKTMSVSKPRGVKYAKSANQLRLEEAIAEVVSSSWDSAIEEEEESDEGSMDSKEFQLIDHPSKFMVDFDSEETSSEEPEYVAQGKLEIEEDFFEAFGYVPEVDELSADVSVKDEKKVDIVETPLVPLGGDTGKFVNPLTGQIDTDATSMPSEEPADRVQMQVQAQSRAQLQAQAQSQAQMQADAQSRAQLQAQAQSQAQMHADAQSRAQLQAQAEAQSRAQLQAQETESSTEEERRSYRSTSSSDLSDTEKKTKSADKFADSKSDMAAAQDDDQETYLHQFMELHKEAQKAEADQLEVDVEALLKEQERLLNLEQTEDFLNNLIHLCVQKAEYVDENIMLRRNLDKAKVIQQLKEKLKEFYAENKRMEFLNRKCADYYSRKNSVRHLAEDDNPIERKRTYYEILHRLDYMLKMERETKAVCSAQKSKCKKKYEIAYESIQKEIQQLEQRIKSTFRNDKLTACVNRQVDKMSTIRKEIYATRLKLFLEQHLYSELCMELTKLEDLGNGLNLKDYDNLETETKALGKKVDERNNILTKLHHHYDASIHSMAHLKEKKSVMKTVVETQNAILTKLQGKKSELRKYITEMKREHNLARHEIKKLSFQSGLLDKPNLMVDYDRTVETANELKALNGAMRQTIESLTHKIAQLEKRSAFKNFQQK